MMVTKKETTNAKDFLRLGRNLKSDYLRGQLTLRELIVLIWLSWNANPNNGRVKTSYSGLVDDLTNLFTGKNQANKTMLALKQKKYIWFPYHKGRRGSFEVEIANYPLSSGKFLDIGYHFQSGVSRRSEEDGGEGDVESWAEVSASQQKFEEGRKRLIKGISTSTKLAEGRSPNNDNDNKNKSIDYKNLLRVSDFEPASYEESLCKRVAEGLGEEHINFVLSVLREHGVGLVEKAWGIFRESDQTVIDNSGAYFNKIVANLIAERGKRSERG